MKTTEVAKKEVFYVTKWGLTAGIWKVSGVYDAELDMLTFKKKPDNPTEWVSSVYVHGMYKNFHMSLEQAELQISVMKGKKLASLRKQIDKLADYKAEITDHTS